MNRRSAMAVCAAAMLAMVLPAAQGTGPLVPQGTGKPPGAADRRHADAGQGGRARLGLAGEGHDESRDAAAALQPGQRAAPPGQADHELHDFELRPRAVLRGRQALRLHLVRDAAQHDVLRRGAAHDDGLPSRRRRADDPHAGCVRVEHPEGHRPRRARDHRSRPSTMRSRRGTRRASPGIRRSDAGAPAAARTASSGTRRA